MRTVDCCEEARLFMFAYLDNEVDSCTAWMIERHIASCPSCNKYYIQGRQLLERVHQVEEYPVPKAFVSRLKRRLFFQRHGRKFIMAAAILILGIPLWTFFASIKQPLIPHQASLMRPAEALTISGSLICVRCEMNKLGYAVGPCNTLGHALAVRGDDGTIWYLLPSRLIDNKVDYQHLPLGDFVEASGVRVAGSEHVIDVSNIIIPQRLAKK